MVHIDGKRAFSCQTQVSEIAGKSVTTIEGLSADSSHPLQRAWLVGSQQSSCDREQGDTPYEWPGHCPCVSHITSTLRPASRLLCRTLGLFGELSVAIDGSKFKAVNNRDKNFTRATGQMDDTRAGQLPRE
jgi:hypothetical protein